MAAALRPAGGWALLVVDMQNDFLDRDGYYARRADLERRADWGTLAGDAQRRLLEEGAGVAGSRPRSERVAEVVRNVCAAVEVARADGRPVVFVRAAYGREFDVTPPFLANDPERVHFPCRPGTWGAAFFGAIAESARRLGTMDRVVEKHTYDAFTNAALPAFLRDRRVESVVVCGTETPVCVLATAQHAALAGRRAFILEDCVWSADADLADAALATFCTAYGATITVADLRGWTR